jgi:putative nucleotidyltransferase with HDIG domain
VNATSKKCCADLLCCHDWREAGVVSKFPILSSGRKVSDVAIDTLLKSVRQLPSISAAVFEVLQTFENEDVDLATIARKICVDQGMTTRILRVSNSAFYGFANRVGTIQDAIALMGLQNIRALVVASGLIQHFPPRTGSLFDWKSFWKHSIGAGVCARVLASRVGQDAELAFTAGILHDIGRLVIEVGQPAKSDAILKYSVDKNVSLLEAERAIFGYDHTLVGFEITSYWKFPSVIRTAIRDHHHPDANSGKLADLIHVGNATCHALEIDNFNWKQLPLRCEEGWTRLGLTVGMLEEEIPEIRRQTSGAQMILVD